MSERSWKPVLLEHAYLVYYYFCRCSAASPAGWVLPFCALHRWRV